MFTNQRARAVEINIAIICSSIPACSSLAKHMSKGRSLFGSLRSLLGSNSLFSTNKTNKSKKSKNSYDSSHLSRGDTDRSRGVLENRYIELREISQQGIIRTVEVEIV